MTFGKTCFIINTEKRGSFKGIWQIVNADRNKTILLVEDEVVIAMAEKRQLSKYNYNIIVANSGEKAVKSFEENNKDVDLVLMDIDLGNGMDGTETARKILEKRDIPVVFLSSHMDPEIVRRTEKITSYGYVVKNANITVLDASIKMAFKLFVEKQRVREKHIQLCETNKKLLAANRELKIIQKKVLEREQALRLSEEQLKEAQKLARIGHWHLDIINNKLEWSDEIYRIFGLMPQEFGATYEAFLQMVHPDDRAEVDNVYKTSLGTKKPYSITHRLKLKNGEVKYVKEKCDTDFDEDGRPISSIGTVQEINS